MRKWFEIKTEADALSAEIYIFDIIGDWIDDIFQFDGVTTAKSFVDAIAKIPETVKTLKVRINSPGGDAFGGITIANTLRAQQTAGRRIETIIEGLAASAASIIAMAGTVVRIADNGILMIHAPWSIAVGNAKDLRAQADILDQLNDGLIKTYQWHSPLSADEIRALIDGANNNGTWMSADEAIAHGFATEKIDGLKAAASLDPRALAKLTIPEKYRAQVHAFTKPSDPSIAVDATEVLRLCREGACVEVAESLIAEAASLEQVKAKIADVQSLRAFAMERVEAITALCASAKLSELAADYIAGAMPLDAVRAQLVTITAKLDKVEIDNRLGPDGEKPRRRASANPNALFVESTH